MQSKTAIITGATSGIGRETARALAAEGIRLVLPVRNLKKGKALQKEIAKKTGNKDVEIFECELSSFASIRSFVKAFKKKYKKLHILINNAGVWESRESVTEDGIERTFSVNHLAPFLMTHELLPLLKKSAPARIITVASEAHRFGSANFAKVEAGTMGWGRMKMYGLSKLANILFTKKLAALLEGTGVTANCLHPGVVATNLFDRLPKFMTRFFSWFMISPEKGAATTIYLAVSDQAAGMSGKYCKKKKARRPALKARSSLKAEELWDISTRMTHLRS